VTCSARLRRFSFLHFFYLLDLISSEWPAPALYVLFLFWYFLC
jgi:hypothetical protein